MRTTIAQQILDENESFAEYTDEQWQKLDDQLADAGTIQRNVHDDSLVIFTFKDQSTLMVDTNGARIGFPCKDCWEFVDDADSYCHKCMTLANSYYNAYYGNDAY